MIIFLKSFQVRIRKVSSNISERFINLMEQRTTILCNYGNFGFTIGSQIPYLFWQQLEMWFTLLNSFHCSNWTLLTSGFGRKWFLMNGVFSGKLYLVILSYHFGSVHVVIHTEIKGHFGTLPKLIPISFTRIMCLFIRGRFTSKWIPGESNQ